MERWRGGATVGCRTLDREVTDSIPSRGVAALGSVLPDWTRSAQTDGRKEGRKENKATHDISPVHSVHLADIMIAKTCQGCLSSFLLHHALHKSSVRCVSQKSTPSNHQR